MDFSAGRRDRFELDRLGSFGQFVRRGRQCAGLSQQRLADLSGVSQSVVSRLERARAPRLALERLLDIQAVLGACLPLGVCPHEHGCIWQPRSDSDLLYRRAPAAPTERVRRDDEWRAGLVEITPSAIGDDGASVDQPATASPTFDVFGLGD